MKANSVIIALMAFSLLLAGCGGHHDHSHAEGHAHSAPHGGVLVEVGAHEYNLEFLLNPTSGRLQAWVLDGHAEAFVRTAMPSFEVVVTTANGPRAVVMLPVANPATGETFGDTSQFEAEAPWLAATGGFEAVVREISVRGTRFENIAFVYPVAEAP